MISSQFQEIVADFVVVGGGTAGCVLATRLAEYGFETLLISSGSDDTTNPMMTEKSKFCQLKQWPHFKHNLHSTSSPNLNDRNIDIIAWNTLGGNGINGGGMERMSANDWKSFVEATGDPSFDYGHMCQYYKMVENFKSTEYSPSSEIHGHNGPINITHDYDPVFHDVWKHVADELDETFSTDLAGTIDYGFSFEPSSLTNGLRSWSGNSYIIPAMAKYPNLKVITGATATKFDLNEETKQINHVLFVSSDGLFSGVAKKEYILSAGTFFSPHLLMLSGIGDPDILQPHAIPVKHTLKQVGKNLTDNGIVVVEYEAKNLPLNQCIPVALVNTTSRTTNTNSDAFLLLKMDNTTKHLYFFIFHASPKSAIGSLSLYNANPLISPKITVDYLKDDNDLNKYIDSINFVRTIMSTNVMKQFDPIIEVSPGIKQMDLSKYVRETLAAGQRFTGTCSMGRNAENSVVDNNFKVHGIRNLRVIDGSVFPVGLASKTGTCLTIYALAEKAANLLRQQYS